MTTLSEKAVKSLLDSHGISTIAQLEDALQEALGLPKPRAVKPVCVYCGSSKNVKWDSDSWYCGPCDNDNRWR